MLRSLCPLIAAAAVVTTALPATAAAQTTFTTFGAFVAAIGPSGTDQFNALGEGPVGSMLSRTAGGFSYSVQASAAAPLDQLFGLANPLAPADSWLTTEEATASLHFGGFSSDVFAIGGHFFATDLSGSPSGTGLRLVAMDIMGNMVDVSLGSTSQDGFFGARFDFALASLMVTADNNNFAGMAYFATANDLVLGAAPQTVPEPASAWLLVTVPGMLLVVRSSRRETRRVRRARLVLS
jgi:hypothetical protein